TTTSTALIGAALGGLASHGTAAQRHPQRSGVLHFGMRNDPGGLDPHRHNQHHTTRITPPMNNGLTEAHDQGNIVPRIARGGEPPRDPRPGVSGLRRGVLSHNGRGGDAKAVKLTPLRMKAPAIGHDYLRGAIETIESVDVLDKYTVRINASVPDVTIPTSVM